MVLTALVPALVIPDEQTWTVLGTDPAGFGVEPVFEAAAARRLLLPERLPQELTEALATLVAALPGDIVAEPHRLFVPGGVPVGEALETSVAVDHDAHAGHEHAGHEHAGHQHGGHEHGGHHDMMAIVGEPSADGLVMEPLELRFGPLGTPLPGGLVAEVTLDGDVVAESTVHSLLRVESGADPHRVAPDPLSPIAWRAAVAQASGEPRGPAAARWVGLAEVELERAVSHLAWLRGLGRLLAWQPLVDACTSALARLDEPRAVLAGEPSGAVERAWDLESELVDAVVDRAASRWVRLRTTGRGVVAADEARERGLTGPAGRASGLADDLRADDALYRSLGFEPVVRPEGDALARTVLRAEEARAAISLAARALEAARAGVTVDAQGAGVEGPRGPLRAQRTTAGWALAAPGAAAARDAAAAAMVGLEWASALVVLSSFDLSPWELDS